MEVSQRALAFLLCRALLCGVALGAFYDLLRITRLWMGENLPPAARSLQGRLALPPQLQFFHMPRGFRRPGKIVSGILIFLEDVLFCLACAVVLILELYVCNDGQFRLSALACLLIGVTAYLMSLGRGVMLVCGTLTALCRVAIVWSLALICYPFYHLFRWMCRLTAPLRCRVRTGCHRMLSRAKQVGVAVFKKMKWKRRAQLQQVTSPGRSASAVARTLRPRTFSAAPGSFHSGNGYFSPETTERFPVGQASKGQTRSHCDSALS